ncbi:MAG: carbon-nitrogen hydrolase family protein [Nitrospinota bacterium]|nr:carbon-nitrogen hydrolase family protein [Nitrospinota bacterium]
MNPIKAAAIQLSPGEDMERNVSRALELVRAAAADGARLIALPEYFFYYGAEERWADAALMSERALGAMMAQARELGVYILAGTALIPYGAKGKFANTSLLFGPDGGRLAVYVKKNLFDVKLDSGEFCESKWLAPGIETVTAPVEGWRLGLAICFDIRFTGHFEELAAQGATAIAIPSAFSLETGAAHWMTLIRARAIETQCYVIAPALWGECGKGKRCFGSTAIVGPWGQVEAVMESGEGYVTALLDPSQVVRVRQKIPMRGGQALPPLFPKEDK